MKIVKRCAYCAQCYNLLPTFLLTPLRGPEGVEDIHYTPALMDDIKIIMTVKHGTIRVPRAKKLWPVNGFRLAFKFMHWHLGIEVHYCS